MKGLSLAGGRRLIAAQPPDMNAQKQRRVLEGGPGIGIVLTLPA